ncbi:hypothetical protein B0H19DRAFT_1185775 [Mycena capillaripes]|nr:hypothetical protein B0H19DRAFT_1185775 [Mycena capillaripes]
MAAGIGGAPHKRRRGKGFWGLGFGGTASRTTRRLRDNIRGVTKPALRRLARRSGVKRSSPTVNADMRGALKILLEGAIRDTTLYSEHGCRKTVTQLDATYALRRNGMTLY